MATHEHYMKLAIQQAQLAMAKDEVPVGAILVVNETIVAKGYNQVELLKDSTAHAEILALTAAYNHYGTKYLPEATLYVTLEPCLMCAGALRWGKLKTIVFGAFDEKNGVSAFTHKNPYHEKATVIGGIMESECAALMKEFFKRKR
jgi:tRNA(adenine34) deaminase